MWAIRRGEEVIKMDDLIIDCFAGGGGASVGIEMALGRHVDIAINHDPEAIRMHEVNHPDTIHLTEDIFKVDLQKYVKRRKVALMWASPDCTSHSKAKGGQPRKKGLRILPWAVYKHAKQILPEVIIMENVEEIQQWGPLDEKGHPIKERQGEDYKKFITAMKSLGYAFDSRELVAANYGARQHENAGMQFSAEMERTLSGQSRRISKIRNPSGNSVEILLIGQTWGNPFLIEKNLSQKLHRKELQTESENMLLKIQSHTLLK